MQLGGQGQPLPLPSKNFPGTASQGKRAGLAVALGSNMFVLGHGNIAMVPPGIWMIQAGTVSVVQFLDPVSTGWLTVIGAGRGGWVNSDGSNYRILNPQEVITGTTITAAGSGYGTTPPTVTPSAGGSTYLPILGGTLTSITVGNDEAGNAGGTNWTLAPTVVVDAPPSPGVQALAYAAVSGGAITSITLLSGYAGAGYTGVPAVRLIANPQDPTYGSITAPTVTAAVGGAGTLTGLIVVQQGIPESSQPTLTISGNATATTVWETGSTNDIITMQLMPGT